MGITSPIGNLQEHDYASAFGAGTIAAWHATISRHSNPSPLHFLVPLIIWLKDRVIEALHSCVAEHTSLPLRLCRFSQLAPVFGEECVDAWPNEVEIRLKQQIYRQWDAYLLHDISLDTLKSRICDFHFYAALEGLLLPVMEKLNKKGRALSVPLLESCVAHRRKLEAALSKLDEVRRVLENI